MNTTSSSSNTTAARFLFGLRIFEMDWWNLSPGAHERLHHITRNAAHEHDQFYSFHHDIREVERQIVPLTRLRRVGGRVESVF